MSLPSYVDATESAVICALIDALLTRGFSVDVFDGEETTLRASTNRAAILSAMASTDSDLIRMRDATGAIRGSFVLVYGNGADVLADHSLNVEAESVAREVYAIAETLES